MSGMGKFPPQRKPYALNTCITISGNLVNKDKSFYWEIRKKIE